MGHPGIATLPTKLLGERARRRLFSRSRVQAELSKVQDETKDGVQSLQLLQESSQPEFNDEQWGKAIAKPIFKLMRAHSQVQKDFTGYMEAENKAEYLLELPSEVSRNNMLMVFGKIQKISAKNNFNNSSEVQSQLYALIKGETLSSFLEKKQQRKLQEQENASKSIAQDILDELRQPVNKLGLQAVHHILKRKSIRQRPINLFWFENLVDVCIQREDARENAKDAFQEAYQVAEEQSLPVSMILEQLFMLLEARQEKLEKIRQKRLMNEITMDNSVRRKILGLIEIQPSSQELTQYSEKVQRLWSAVEGNEDMKYNLKRLEELRQEREEKKKEKEKLSLWKRVRGWFGSK